MVLPCYAVEVQLKRYNNNYEKNNSNLYFTFFNLAC